MFVPMLGRRPAPRIKMAAARLQLSTLVESYPPLLTPALRLSTRPVLQPDTCGERQKVVGLRDQAHLGLTLGMLFSDARRYAILFVRLESCLKLHWFAISHLFVPP